MGKKSKEFCRGLKAAEDHCQGELRRQLTYGGFDQVDGIEAMVNGLMAYLVSFTTLEANNVD